MLRIRLFKKGGIMKKLRVVFVTLFLKKNHCKTRTNTQKYSNRYVETSINLKKYFISAFQIHTL